jgi:hypothetical protein
MRDLGLPSAWAPRLLSLLRIVSASIAAAGPGPWSLHSRLNSGARR